MTLATSREDLGVTPRSLVVGALPSITPGPGDPAPPSGLHAPQVLTWSTDMLADKAPTHMKRNKPYRKS